MATDDDRRRHTRVDVDAPGEIADPDGTMRPALVRNVSLRGMLLTYDGKLPIGSKTRVALMVGEGDEQTQIDAEAEVVRLTDDGELALAITQIGGHDESMLRRTILDRAAATSASDIEREFDQTGDD